MKIKIITLALLFAMAIGQVATAQSLFKDLAVGNNSSNPQQLMNVNGTLYFITNVNPTYNHQLWKSDGTVANTVILKDSIIFSAIGDVVYFRCNINDTLYYSVNNSGITAGVMTYLYKTNGGTPVLIDSLSHPGMPGFGGGYPTQFTVVGNKIFFTMWKVNGRELWVTDGTAAGTIEVIDLNPGDNGAGVKYSGVADMPMCSFNGKVFFQGSAVLGGKDLYSSDGTAGGTTLVKANIDPKHFIVYNGELFFSGDDGVNAGLWKTDGTGPGTQSVSNTGFNNDARIFNNEMFYSVGGTLWKSNGTAVGTVPMMDSAGGMTGINNGYFYTSYMRSLPVPPYYEMYYWKSDGTVGGTARTSYDIGSTASFIVLNNNMYQSHVDSGTTNLGLWVSDGTAAGTSKLLSGYVTYPPIVLDTTVFFSNFSAAEGYELWWLHTAGTVGIQDIAGSDDGLNIYPNPSASVFKLAWSGSRNAKIQVSDIMGKVILDQLVAPEINLSGYPGGIYFVKITDGQKLYTCKILLQ